MLLDVLRFAVWMPVGVAAGWVLIIVAPLLSDPVRDGVTWVWASVELLMLVVTIMAPALWAGVWRRVKGYGKKSLASAGVANRPSGKHVYRAKHRFAG